MSDTLTRINGGSMDTDVNALTVSPRGPSSVSNVTTTTPVAKRPRQERSDGEVMTGGAVMQ